MTVSACRDLGSSGEKWQKLLINGGRYYLNVNSGSRCDLRSGWMTSGKRMALGIPLHPNRMTRKDWEQLPGIGPSLANKIEKDRQKNGDFVSIEDLARVHGIGKARISNWNRFF
ncbi:MAG: hypothetical protein C0616_10710 [Desulfuromonas sp.]|nr:MAG: hypothetical protein C0616_10710 [Desulfuromonas sp.]